MYARRLTQPKPRQSALKSFPAPIAGWIANRALAVPNAPNLSQGAAILDNFFPTATSVWLRRGKVRYGVLGDGSKDCESLFSYNDGTRKALFGATDTTIYDITNMPFPYDVLLVDDNDNPLGDGMGNTFGWGSTDLFIKMGGFTGGNWVTAQFAATGGAFLIGVNGADVGFIFDGDNFYPNIPGGIHRLAYDDETIPFNEGSVLTGATSGATGTIFRILPDEGNTGSLFLTDVTGAFADEEAITDAVGGAATANGPDDIASPGVTFPAGTTIADMSHVWVYQNRIWFAQKGVAVAWYLDEVDSIGGNAVPFPLQGVYALGGALLFGQTWSLEGGASGGLSEQCVFVSDEGEVAVYQGDFPGDADTWGKVGLYRIGKPLGNRAFLRGGGDIAIATSVGLVPLSKAMQLDVTALNTASVSYNIADAWSEAVTLRGLTDWQAQIWPEQKMAVISPPQTSGTIDPVMFVANTDTGAWGRFTGWHGLCLEVFDGKLYFGSPNGLVFIANQSGQDDGETYSGAVMPLFDDLGAPACEKIPTVGRAVIRASTKITDLVSFHADFDVTLPTSPNASTITSAPSIWGAGQWGLSTWGAGQTMIISQDWRSLAGYGYAASLSLQITSGAIPPLDAEIVRMEMMYTQAEFVT